MFIGHYSISFIAKRIEPQIPLWILFLAVQFIDIIWSLFIFIGIEKANISHALPGIPLNLIYMPYTHSLLGALFWSILAFFIIRFMPILRARSTKNALIVASAVFSHWVLDLVVHTADLPLWLNKYKVGFGLYESAIISFFVEAIILSVGLILYLQVTNGKGFLGTYGIYIFIILMFGLDANTVWGISPPNSQIAAGFLLFCYLIFAILIAGIERKRVLANFINGRNIV